MSRCDRNDDLNLEGDSTATLEPVERATDLGLLDQLAKKLNVAAVQTEPIDFQRMQQLEMRLADREQLVSILTERLEQAADELDRIKRTGGVLAKTPGDTASVASLLEGHSEVAATLDHFVRAWEERYEGPALRRMEAGIEELRERLEQATLQSHISSGSQSDSHFPSGHRFEGRIQEEDRDTYGESDTPSDDAPAHSTLHRRSNDAAPIRLVLISSENVPDDLDVPLPESVDETDVPELELRKAITDRDAYITWLCHRMRDITGQLEDWMTSLRVDSDDTTLHRRVDEIEQLIHEQLRVSEIEVSIERARLSREQAKLHEATQRLAREREQLAKPSSLAEGEEDTPLVRRWKKFMKPSDA